MFRPRSLGLAVVLALLSFASSARADLILSLANVTGPTGGAGTFEVLLTNPSDGQSVDVASFSFALMVPTGAGIEFTAADTSPLSVPYLFEGTGGASVDPGFTLSLDPFPNGSLTGSDTEFTFLSITVNPGDVYGLGRISYSVAPNAPGGDVPISFIPEGTSLAGEDGGIAFTSDASAGVIHITEAVVPEPSSLVLATGALGLMFLGKWPLVGKTPSR